MFAWNRHAVAAALFGISLFTTFEARAEKVKVVSGLVGAQDSESKELLALSPAAANQVATRDLLSVLKPTGEFILDNSRNVEGTAFITPPYQTNYRFVCREDLVTLHYRLEDRFDAAGKYLDFKRHPVGIEAQQVFHIEQLPVPGFSPDGRSYRMTECNTHQPGASATWFAAPSATDAVRAANMFRMAVDEMKADRLRPRACDSHGGQACRQWVLSLDDVSKIKSVEPCATKQGDNACYVISFDAVDVTVTGTIPTTEWEQITPTAITSIRAENVVTLSE